MSRLPLFEGFVSESLNHSDLMTFESARIMADGMLKQYDKTEYTPEEREAKIDYMARVALEKHIERSDFKNDPEYETLLKRNIKAVKRIYPNNPDDKNVGYAIQYTMEDILEKNNIKKEEEEHQESVSDAINTKGKAIKPTKIPSRTPNKSIDMYKKNLYMFQSINTQLRDKSKLSDFDTNFVNEIESAISANALQSDAILVRILDRDGFPFKLKPNAKYLELGFLSTSYDLDYLMENISNYDDPVLMEIMISAGTKYYKFPNDFESEILFGTGHTIKVLSEEEYQGIPYFKCKLDK